MVYENLCASLGFEPDTFGVERDCFTNSATPPLVEFLLCFLFWQFFSRELEVLDKEEDILA